MNGSTRCSGSLIVLVALSVVAACDWTIDIEDSATDIVAVDLNADGRIDLAMSAIQLFAAAPPHPSKALVTLQSADSPPLFLPLREYRVANGAHYIAAGDLDGDGRVDLAVSARDEARIAVLRQDPARPGCFRKPEHWMAGELPFEIAIGDFDADGLGDLAVEALDGELRRVFLLIQDRRNPGAFSDLRVIDQPQSVTGLTAADFDGDGLDDLAVASIGDPELPGTVELLLQDPDVPGSFLRGAGRQVGIAPGRLRSADLDGDGSPDLLVVNAGVQDRPGTSSVSVLLQRAGVSGVLEQAVELLVGEPVKAVDGGDLDGDGRGDLAVALGDRIALLFQDSTARGVFLPPVTFATRTFVTEVRLADFDADGRTDIAVDDHETAAIYYQITTAPGTFQPPLRVGR